MIQTGVQVNPSLPLKFGGKKNPEEDTESF